MDNKELKEILIEELGSMPFKDKKIITQEGKIPEELLNKLITKNEKKRKYTRIMLLIILTLILTSLVFSYFLDVDELTFLLFGAALLIQIPQLVFHKDYKDNSKRTLIYQLLIGINKSDLKN